MNLRRAALFSLALAAGGHGCKSKDAPPEDPQQVFGLVDALLEAGDTVRAAELLTTTGLESTEEGLWFQVEIAIMDGAYEDAFAILESRVDVDAEHVTLLEDACAMGTLAASEAGDVAQARARVAHCERSQRLDVRALRMEYAETAPDEDATTALLDALAAAESGPETDVAAAALERGFVGHAEAADDDLEAIRLLNAAFAVAQSEEVGNTLAQAYYDAAEARFESEPQQAATLYEHLYLQRVEGLTPPEELRALATRRAHEALFPVYLRNFRARYDRKFAEDDTALGWWDGASGTFDVGRLDDDALWDAYLTWLFQRLERPRPRPTPDPLAWAEVCEDRSQPCRFTFETHARIAYYMRHIEEAYLAANPGVTFEWGGD